MSDPVKSNRAISSLETLAEALSSAATSSSRRGPPLLRFLKDGTWVYGQESKKIECNSVWAPNPYQATHGFACWPESGRRLLGEVMVPVTQPTPELTSL